jgi:hypothetical protein
VNADNSLVAFNDFNGRKRGANLWFCSDTTRDY